MGSRWYEIKTVIIEYMGLLLNLRHFVIASQAYAFKLTL